MFETQYAERAEALEADGRYCDVPLGVEAAWPPLAGSVPEWEAAESMSGRLSLFSSTEST